MIRQARCHCSTCAADARANRLLFLLAMACVFAAGYLR
jgi:hypothetical protein